MFEKEAEEYWLKQPPFTEVRDRVIQAFIDGAEYGYNKANEWHYPSKGEYPRYVNVLGYFEDRGCCICFYDADEGEWYKCLSQQEWTIEPVAWQYLPELPKEV